MIRYFLSIALFACGTVCGISVPAPGRLAMWSPAYSAGANGPQYQTQDVDTRAISSLLDTKTESKEALVILQHEDVDFDLVGAVSHLFRQASDAVVVTTVYKSSISGDSLVLKNSDANVMEMSFADFLNVAASKVLTNEQLDVVVVTLTSGDDISAIANMQFADAAEILLAAYERPSAVAPVNRADYVSRRLAETGSTNPEGSEFSIYYENTYLYLTPDIFTGLMTMLFVCFVLYTGYGCLGAIQGPSTFANKLPTLGKE